MDERGSPFKDRRSQFDAAESLAATLSLRALTPDEAAEAVDVILAVTSAARQAFELLREAYPDPDDWPSNDWRRRVEDLGAWPLKGDEA